METLSALFQKSKGAPVKYAGKLVYPIFQRELEGMCAQLRIKRISQNSAVAQGLRIKLDNGELEINGQQLKDIVIWADTSPDEVQVRVIGKSNVGVKVWNVWRYGDLMQAWTGNAGIQIEEKNGLVRLSCSDGVGEPDFTDLIVQIEFESA
ncbi:MAG: hypothetical protein ABIT70_05070 [Sulfuriferula sp.]